jgi:hypothetical protein
MDTVQRLPVYMHCPYVSLFGRERDITIGGLTLVEELRESAVGGAQCFFEPARQTSSCCSRHDGNQWLSMHDSTTVKTPAGKGTGRFLRERE